MGGNVHRFSSTIGADDEREGFVELDHIAVLGTEASDSLY